MARFSSNSRLVQAICDGVEQMHQRHSGQRQFDGHDLINWLDANRNRELNEIYDLYDDCKDPEMTADQQLGKFLYDLGQIKIGDKVSQRRITLRDGNNRNGKCTVSVWEISQRTIDGLSKATQKLLGRGSAIDELDLLGRDLSAGSVADAFGAAPVLRSGDDILAQVRAERDEWGDR